MAPSLISSASCASAPVKDRLMPILTVLSAAKPDRGRPPRAPTRAVVDKLICNRRRDSMLGPPRTESSAIALANVAPRPGPTASASPYPILRRGSAPSVDVGWSIRARLEQAGDQCAERGRLAAAKRD